ncbi:hypothetical protein [Panacagrimonas sp.]|uniref:hypothetical protein n=1 Tax=Panacagrimonas sp. TaxID=2480088 RepID=UPI003B52EDD7
MSAATDALRRELGSPPPAAFGALPDAVCKRLAEALRDARLRQQQELDQALTRALEYVPALMRRPVRKILGL